MTDDLRERVEGSKLWYCAADDCRKELKGYTGTDYCKNNKQMYCAECYQNGLFRLRRRRAKLSLRRRRAKLRLRCRLHSLLGIALLATRSCKARTRKIISSGTRRCTAQSATNKVLGPTEYVIPAIKSCMAPINKIISNGTRNGSAGMLQQLLRF